MRFSKSANSHLFKEFDNEAEMEKNKPGCRIYYVIVPLQSEKREGRKLSKSIIQFHNRGKLLKDGG